MLSFAEEAELLRELEALAGGGQYEQLLERLDRLQPTVVAGRTRLALLAAEAQGRLGAYDVAEAWAAKALELARSRGERYAELRARQHQAAIALSRGNLEDAEQHFAAALQMAHVLRDYVAEARSFNNLGIVAFLRGDPRAALGSYQRALSSYQRAGFLRGIVETHHNIAISRRELADNRGALEAADQALRLALLENDQTLIGLVLTGRAELHLTMGDIPLAEAELRAAEQAYERVRFRRGLAEVWRVQGGVARARGDQEAAVRRLQAAADLARELGSAEVLSASERDLGLALLAAGEHAAARTAWQRALAIFERLGSSKEINAIHALLERARP